MSKFRQTFLRIFPNLLGSASTFTLIENLALLKCGWKNPTAQISFLAWALIKTKDFQRDFKTCSILSNDYSRYWSYGWRWKSFKRLITRLGSRWKPWSGAARSHIDLWKRKWQFAVVLERRNLPLPFKQAAFAKMTVRAELSSMADRQHDWRRRTKRVEMWGERKESRAIGSPIYRFFNEAGLMLDCGRARGRRLVKKKNWLLAHFWVKNGWPDAMWQAICGTAVWPCPGKGGDMTGRVWSGWSEWISAVVL